MKFFTAALAVLSSFTVDANTHQQDDIYYHQKPALGASMWHFSADGLTIFSPDGKNVLKEHRKESLCRPYMNWRGEMNNDCYYFSQASDGHKYVWAASFAVKPHVEAFDIDTGDYAGYINTCSTPLDLEYHAVREEMWVRCAQNMDYDGHFGEIDVFSSNSLSSDFDLISLNDTMRPYGRISIHSSMGPYGYVSAYDQNYISELDLSSKSVSNRYEIPKAVGSYDLTYSPVNQHMFTRARVCCSCGFEGADNLECSSRGAQSVIVQTGPSESVAEQDGACGAGCEGTTADTIGVIEFDTVGKTIVAEHNIKEGTGFGADPVGSPDGKYILLLANDGGQYVRLIKAGTNGQPSEILTDIQVDFVGGTPGRTVVSDFAFVNNNGRDILVLGASTDNHLVIVDLMDPAYRAVKLPLTDAEESTGGSSRKLEWAVDTNYVWVNGGESMEVYVIEIPEGIDSAVVVSTLTDITSGDMIYVNNYERLRETEQIERMMAPTIAALAIEPENNGEALGISGIVIGAGALVVGLVVGATVFSNKSKGGNGIDVETTSLGSKNVA